MTGSFGVAGSASLVDHSYCKPLSSLSLQLSEEDSVVVCKTNILLQDDRQEGPQWLKLSSVDQQQV